MIKCDHTIGYLNNFITQSEIADITINESSAWNCDARTMNSLSLNTGILKDDYVPADFIDRRRNLMKLFNYCPDCGEKINWRQIKFSIKEVA